MPCKICSHTLHRVNAYVKGEKEVFWCPRCGSLFEMIPHMGREYEATTPPKLVERVREFVRMIDGGPAGRFLREQAEVSGILESTLPPHERPADPFPGAPLPVAPLADPKRTVPINRDPTPEKT